MGISSVLFATENAGETPTPPAYQAVWITLC